VSTTLRTFQIFAVVRGICRLSLRRTKNTTARGRERVDHRPAWERERERMGDNDGPDVHLGGRADGAREIRVTQSAAHVDAY
jgi:hypothetical protein